MEWDDRPLSAASWILLKSLIRMLPNGGIYSKRSDILFFAGHMFPKLPISGSPEEHLSDLDHETISESPLIRQLLWMRRSMRLEFVFLNRFSDCR